jgi:hypothetical protein
MVTAVLWRGCLCVVMMGGEVELDRILGAPGGSSRRKRSLAEPAAGGAAAPGFDC